MMKRTLHRTFPDTVINEVDGNGHPNTNEERGVEVTLHWRETDQAPVMAEVSSKTGDHYAEVGLQFKGLELVDYDGVFEMPSEVVALLKDNGFDVSYVEDFNAYYHLEGSTMDTLKKDTPKKDTLPALTHEQVGALLDTLVFVDLPYGGMVRVRVAQHKYVWGKNRWGVQPLDGAGIGWYECSALKLGVLLADPASTSPPKPVLMVAGWPEGAASLVSGRHPAKVKQTWAALVKALRQENL